MGFSQVVMYAHHPDDCGGSARPGKPGVQTADQVAPALQPSLARLRSSRLRSAWLGPASCLCRSCLARPLTPSRNSFGLKGDLGSKPADRPTYGVIGAAAVARVVFNFLHIDPRALFHAAVINGLVAPPLMLQIVMLGSDLRG